MITQTTPRSATNVLRPVPIERVRCTHPTELRERITSTRWPSITSGLIDKWPAQGKWSPHWFKKHYGNIRFRPSVGLPRVGCPYEETWSDYQRDMSLGEFVNYMEREHDACYIRRQNVKKFLGAENDLRFEEVVPTDRFGSNTFVWFGCNTRTGLHFDLADNMLCQMYGEKHVYMVAPDQSRLVYPYRGSVTKSRVMPNELDYDRFPAFSRVTVHTGRLRPGEVLFIPRRWWHSIIADGVSISVSHDFGEKVSMQDIASAVWAGGPLHAATVVRDFVWHGVLRRPFRRRLFDDPPFGHMIYGMVIDALRRRMY